jgi:hypothetical protein
MLRVLTASCRSSHHRRLGQRVAAARAARRPRLPACVAARGSSEHTRAASASHHPQPRQLHTHLSSATDSMPRRDGSSARVPAATHAAPPRTHPARHSLRAAAPPPAGWPAWTRPCSPPPLPPPARWRPAAAPRSGCSLLVAVRCGARWGWARRGVGSLWRARRAAAGRGCAASRDRAPHVACITHGAQRPRTARGLHHTWCAAAAHATHPRPLPGACRRHDQLALGAPSPGAARAAGLHAPVHAPRQRARADAPCRPASAVGSVVCAQGGAGAGARRGAGEGHDDSPHTQSVRDAAAQAKPQTTPTSAEGGTLRMANMHANREAPTCAQRTDGNTSRTLEPVGGSQRTEQ